MQKQFRIATFKINNLCIINYIKIIENKSVNNKFKEIIILK